MRAGHGREMRREGVLPLGNRRLGLDVMAVAVHVAHRGTHHWPTKPPENSGSSHWVGGEGMRLVVGEKPAMVG